MQMGISLTCLYTKIWYTVLEVIFMQTVLVCDDDKAILDSIEIYLKAEGYNVLKAENGLQALELIKDNEIHCMVLDIMMPGMDGLQTTLKIREQQKSFPIIMLSAKSEDTDKIAGLGVGGLCYQTVQSARACGKSEITDQKIYFLFGLRSEKIPACYRRPCC